MGHKGRDKHIEKICIIRAGEHLDPDDEFFAMCLRRALKHKLDIQTCVFFHSADSPEYYRWVPYDKINAGEYIEYETLKQDVINFSSIYYNVYLLFTHTEHHPDPYQLYDQLLRSYSKKVKHKKIVLPENPISKLCKINETSH